MFWSTSLKEVLSKTEQCIKTPVVSCLKSVFWCIFDMHVLNYDLRKLRICWRSRIKHTHTCDDARLHQGWTDVSVSLIHWCCIQNPWTSSSFFTRDVSPDETQTRSTSLVWALYRQKPSLLHWCFSVEQTILNSVDVHGLILSCAGLPSSRLVRGHELVISIESSVPGSAKRLLQTVLNPSSSALCLMSLNRIRVY